ncbi:hypothetical protein D3C80_1307890 [compost metagenome]
MKVITGKVHPMGDSDGLPGVLVSEKGTVNSATTSNNGSFTLVASSPTAVIEFTKSGYQKKSIVAGSFNSFINLNADFENPVDLDGVTITVDKTDRTMLYVALAAVVGVAGYFAFRKKKPQPQKVKV